MIQSTDVIRFKSGVLQACEKLILAVAIGLAAIQNGYTVYYRSAFDLVTRPNLK